MTAGLNSLPQNSVNHRPTIALFSSVDTFVSFVAVHLAPSWAHALQTTAVSVS
jgi:hypothetical protein